MFDLNTCDVQALEQSNSRVKQAEDDIKKLDKKLTIMLTCESGKYYSTKEEACAKITECKFPAEYQVTAAQLAKDAVCKATTVCCTEAAKCKTLQFASTPATLKTDRKCSTVAVCKSGFVELKKPTATTNRECGILKKEYAFEKKIVKHTIVNAGVYKVGQHQRTCIAMLHLSSARLHQ